MRDADSRRLTIVALGDSTTAGTPGFRSPLEAPPHGQGDERSQYAFWLNLWHPEWRVLNRGVDGERSDQIQDRFGRDVLEARPRIVVVIAGVNDIYQGRPARTVMEHLRRMYDSARSAAIVVVAGSILPFDTATEVQNRAMRTVNDWIRQCACEDDNIHFCDTREAAAHPGDPDRLRASPDGLHPDVDGYRRVAEALNAVLERITAS